MIHDLDTFGSSAIGDFRESGNGDRRRSPPFTIRLWVRHSHTGGSGSYLNRLTSGVGFDLGETSSAVRLTISTNRGGFASNTITALDSFSINTWFRIVCGWDGANLFMQINNGDRKTQPWGNEMGIADGASLNLKKRYSASTRHDYDELGIWKNYAWTQTDSDADWNGGAGRTYPDIPLEGLVGYWTMESFSGSSPNVLTSAVGSYQLTAADDVTSVIDTGKVGNGLALTDSSSPVANPTAFSLTNADFELGV